ncbi:hypothetical protein AAMO2058_001019300 [Amorphochlora amoebiformis]
MESDEAPERFRCPITKMVMVDPVLTSELGCYEYRAITMYIAQATQLIQQGMVADPLSGRALSSPYLIPNLSLRRQIRLWRQKHNKPETKLSDSRIDQLAGNAVMRTTFGTQSLRSSPPPFPPPPLETPSSSLHPPPLEFASSSAPPPRSQLQALPPAPPPRFDLLCVTCPGVTAQGRHRRCPSSPKPPPILPPHSRNRPRHETIVSSTTVTIPTRKKKNQERPRKES